MTKCAVWSFSLSISLLCGASNVAIAAATHVKKQHSSQKTTKASHKAGRHTPTSMNATAEETISVVTHHRPPSAQRRGESILQVSQSQMQALNISRPEDLVKLAPGLTAIPNAGTDVSSFSVRNVGAADFGEQEEQNVGNYQDGVYVANPGATGFPIFDLQTVALNRGPQGTSGGRNANGGTINYISNKPTAGKSANIEGTYGSYNLHRFQGFFNYGNEKVAGRLAFYYSKQGGYIRNLVGANLRSSEVYGLRPQVRFNLTPKDTFTIRLEGFIQDHTTVGDKHVNSYTGSDGLTHLLPGNMNAYGTGPGRDPYGYRSNSNPWSMSVNDPGAINKVIGTISGTYEHVFVHQIKLTAISSYGTSNTYYREDTDGTTVPAANFHQHSNVNQASTEVTLHHDVGRNRWGVGAYFLNISGAYDFLQGYQDPSTMNPLSVAPTSAFAGLAYSQRTTAGALYAHDEFDILPNLTVVSGLRYNHNDMSYSSYYNCNENLPGACSSFFGAGGANSWSKEPHTNLHQQDNEWNGRIGLNYRIIPNIMLWGLVARNTKAPGFSAPNGGATIAANIPYKRETVYDYEGGIKTRFFHNTLTINADWFYYDFKNFQASIIYGPVASVVNRPATNRGGELDASWRPGYGITISGGVAYANLRVKDVRGGITQYPINAPKYQATANVSKEFKISDEIGMTLTYNMKYTSGRYYNIINAPGLYAPGYIVHDMALRVESKKGWYASVFANNLTDKAYPNAIMDNTGQGFVQYMYAPRRTVGGTIGYKF